MSDDKVTIKFLGTNEIAFKAPGFHGKVNNGDEIEIEKWVYDSELKGSPAWELVKEVKERKSKKTDSEGES